MRVSGGRNNELMKVWNLSRVEWFFQSLCRKHGHKHIQVYPLSSGSSPRLKRTLRGGSSDKQAHFLFEGTIIKRAKGPIFLPRLFPRVLLTPISAVTPDWGQSSQQSTWCSWNFSKQTGMQTWKRKAKNESDISWKKNAGRRNSTCQKAHPPPPYRALW